MIRRWKARREERRLLAAVLAEVNVLRARDGMAPLDSIPKGERMAARSCPLARALEAVVDRTGYTPPAFHRASHEFPANSPCPEFVRRFDAGELPAFEA